MSALRRSDLDPDPLRQVDRWRYEAAEAGVDTTLAALATASATGRPSVRMVLVKGVDEGVFRFYTNYESRKAAELAENPLAALLFHWPGRQVRVEGGVERLPEAESDAYFDSRPPGSRLSAAVSPQSRPVGSRAELEAAVEELRQRHPDGAVPRPASWGGYLLRPRTFEFWQHDRHRMHDRFRYTTADGGWLVERLGP
ncbi:MAG TPA: pyridoxamine 5'-phosphate oxidase [Gaiellales bacterium]|nr:pyridoxamine 5'-phosphate oxidase [Gaiellales bacterium]